MPILEDIWKRAWIQEDIIGKLEEIKEEISKDFHPSRIDPLPENLREYYSREYQRRRVKSDDTSFEEYLKKMSNKAEMLIMKFWSELMYGKIRETQHKEEDIHYSDKENTRYTNTSKNQPVLTLKRDQPKVGRNEPCPCGSGKKYKKCCLRKK